MKTMNVKQLESHLAEVRAAKSDVDDHKSMVEAWLLFALGRSEEGIKVVRRAQELWEVFRAKFPPPYTSTLYWDANVALAAVALEKKHWAVAERLTREVLCDFEEEDQADYLFELALQAQGRLPPNLLYRSGDPAQALAAFDLSSYAVQRLLNDPFFTGGYWKIRG